MVLQYLRLNWSDKCVLFVYFGEQNDRVYGLKSENVPPDEANHIRKEGKNLKEKSETIQWLKENAPVSYKNAYREYKKSDFILLTSHVVNTLA